MAFVHVKRGRGCEWATTESGSGVSACQVITIRFPRGDAAAPDKRQGACVLHAVCHRNTPQWLIDQVLSRLRGGRKGGGGCVLFDNYGSVAATTKEA